jgi:hypothetical protein
LPALGRPDDGDLEALPQALGHRAPARPRAQLPLLGRQGPRTSWRPPTPRRRSRWCLARRRAQEAPRQPSPGAQPPEKTAERLGALPVSASMRSASPSTSRGRAPFLRRAAGELAGLGQRRPRRPGRGGRRSRRGAMESSSATSSPVKLGPGARRSGPAPGRWLAAVARERAQERPCGGRGPASASAALRAGRQAQDGDPRPAGAVARAKIVSGASWQDRETGRREGFRAPRVDGVWDAVRRSWSRRSPSWSWSA